MINLRPFSRLLRCGAGRKSITHTPTRFTPRVRHGCKSWRDLLAKLRLLKGDVRLIAGCFARACVRACVAKVNSRVERAKCGSRNRGEADEMRQLLQPEAGSKPHPFLAKPKDN